MNIVRRSIDARKTRGPRNIHSIPSPNKTHKNKNKNKKQKGGIITPKDKDNDQDNRDIRLIYSVHANLKDESMERELALTMSESVRLVEDINAYCPTHYPLDSHVIQGSKGRPVVVGSGPGGLFAAYTLACSGFRPIVIEFGPRVERRAKDLMQFWKENILTPNSNGVFGEGGAGAFSDGKLTTRTTSPYHRFIHETLIEYGAKSNILYETRAHVGTDQLRKIIT